MLHCLHYILENVIFTFENYKSTNEYKICIFENIVASVLSRASLLCFFFSFSHFLVADTQLCKRLCPSVCPLVRRSVGPSVMIELKSGKTSVLNTFCVYLSVGGMWGGGRVW